MSLTLQDRFETLLAIQARIEEVEEALKTLRLERPTCLSQQLACSALEKRAAELRGLQGRLELHFKEA